MLEYCTLPRTGALEVILDILGPVNKVNNGFANSNLQDDSKISKICDVTIAYPEGKPIDLFQIGFGSRPPCVTHVHYRVFDVKDVSLLSEISDFSYKKKIRRGESIKIQPHDATPSFQGNLETYNTSFEIPNIELLKLGKKLSVASS